MFRFVEEREFSCVDAQSDDDRSWISIVEQPRLKAALVKDVCLATTAAPTFLPPVHFTVPPTEDKEKKEEDKKDHTKKADDILEFNMIDGGIAVNNPVGFS
jgi:patatin-like phospholipase/acyl hydrolase